MSAVPKNSATDVMTEERLRAHWFGGPQVPFWNYDPAQLTIGLEVEYFIAKVEGESFTLATKQQYLETMAHLVASAGYKDRNLPDQPGRISKDTSSGFIAIKPDFAWHILEISLPPRGSLSELRNLITDTFKDIDAALTKVGLSRLKISCLPSAPKKFDLVELERLDDFTKLVGLRQDKSPFVDPFFPAYMVATHVHLNAFDSKALDFWPALFALESMFGEIYCRAKRFSGIDVPSVRTEFLNQTMGDGYKLKGIPTRIPRNAQDYVEAMNASNHAFPKDRFFPVRDVSYVRPSKYGTIEFRSACSTTDVDALVEIAGWRITQALTAYNSISKRTELRESLKISIDLLVARQILTADEAIAIERRLGGLRGSK